MDSMIKFIDDINPMTCLKNLEAGIELTWYELMHGFRLTQLTLADSGRSITLSRSSYALETLQGDSMDDFMAL